MAGAPSARLRIALLVVLLFGFGLRLWRLDTQELRGDEAFGFFFSQQPLTQIASQTLALAEPHPMGSYVIQRTWSGWAGTSEMSLRFPSAWFSVLALALVFRLARSTAVPRSIAVISAGLLAFSPYAVWHAQDARMYSMSLALTLASSLLAVMWLERRSAASAVSYVAISLLALHTHYFAVYILLAQNLYAVLLAVARPRRSEAVRGSLAGWALMQTALALLYAPWIIAARHVLLDYHGNGDSPRLGEAALRSLAVFAGGESTPPEHRVIVASVGLALAVIGLVMLSIRPGVRKAALWNALYLGVPILATWASATSRPIFNERYLAAAAPPFYVLAASSLMAFHWRAAGAEARWKVWGLRAGVGLLMAVFVAGLGLSLARYYSDPAYSKTRGWRDLATRLDHLSACVPADDVRLVQNYPDPTLWYYYDGPVEHLVLPPVAHGGQEARALVEDLAAKGVRRIIVVEQPAATWDEDGIARNAIGEVYALAADTTSGSWPVVLYAMPPPTMEPVHAQFANGVVLERVSVEPESVVEGGAIVVNADWSAGVAEDGRELKVFIHLLDSQGRLAAQQDRVFPADRTKAAGGDLHATYGILAPETLDAGVYSLIAGLYYSEDEGSWRVPAETGADHVVLASVQVARSGRCPESAAKID